MPPDSSITSDSEREYVVIQEKKIPNRRESSGPKYNCSICGESFKRIEHLDRHEYHHTGVKKHVCTYEGCDKTYSILAHLKRHFRTTHERTAPAVKNVKCLVEECGKLFPSLTNMHRHIREVHENPKVYFCGYCQEKFTQKLKMRRHEISKHTKEYPFNCDKCSKGFYQEYHLIKHAPLCKVYPCSGCELKFDKWTNYIKHCKDTQHGRKYYNCELCPRIYSRSGELQRHILVQHAEGDMPLNFKCSHENCGRAYAYERNLKQHIKIAHSGKRFQCTHENCERDFTSAQNLAKHIKREHSTRPRKRAHSSCSEDEVVENGDAKKTKDLKQPRKKRKDAGQPKVSNLATVTGFVIVERDLDARLREREPEVMQAFSDQLTRIPQEPNASEFESDCSVSNVVFKKTCAQLENSSEFESDSTISKVLGKNASKEVQLERLMAIAMDD